MHLLYLLGGIKKMSNDNKDALKTLFAILVLVIIIISVLMIKYAFSGFHDYSLTTGYGDEFRVLFDSYKNKSMITNDNSDLELCVSGKIKKDDFIGLKETNSIKVYRLQNYAIFDKGNGFAALSSDNINENPEVAEIVIGTLLSDRSFFVENIEHLLNSKKYNEDALRIIELIEKWDYNKLMKYGLDESLVNDNSYIQCYKQDAIYALNEYKKHK